MTNPTEAALRKLVTFIDEKAARNSTFFVSDMPLALETKAMLIEAREALSTPAPDPVGMAEIERIITELRNAELNAGINNGEPQMKNYYEQCAQVHWEALISAISRLAQGGQSWQPISTAPLMRNDELHVLMPVTPSDYMLIMFMNEVHSNVPEVMRPQCRSSFSDEQWTRLHNAYQALLQARSNEPRHTSEHESLLDQNQRLRDFKDDVMRNAVNPDLSAVRDAIAAHTVVDRQTNAINPTDEQVERHNKSFARLLFVIHQYAADLPTPPTTTERAGA